MIKKRVEPSEEFKRALELSTRLETIEEVPDAGVSPSLLVHAIIIDWYAKQKGAADV